MEVYWSMKRLIFRGIYLTSFAVLTGYKFQAKNMTAMSVQVLGTLLNKNVSTGDD